MIFFTLNDDFNHEKQCNLLHNYHFKYTVIFIELISFAMSTYVS